MRKYIALIATLVLMTAGLNAQAGRASGLSGTGLDGFIEQTQFDSLHVDAGTFVYWVAGSGQEVSATGDELNYLDIAALGTGAASKAIVLDSGDDYTWPATGLLTYWGTAISATGLELNVLDGIAATLTYDELDYLDIAALGTGVASKAVVLNSGDDYTWPIAGILTYGVLNDGTTTLSTSALKLNYVDITTLGTQEASMVVTTDANVNSGISKVTQLWIGSTGAETQVTSTAAQLNAIPATTSSAAQLDYVDIASLGTGVNTKAVVLDAGGDYTWEAGGVFKYAVLNDGTTALTTSTLKLNYVDITTLGTQEASMVVTADANVNSGISKVTQLWIGSTGAETQVDATATELNYNDITTLGTQEASKVVTTDANVNSGISKITQLWIGSTGAEVQVASTALELDQRALTVKMIDVSSAGQVHVVSPYAGDVTAVYSVLNATIATAPAGITIKDKDGNVMGTITIADGGSGPGDVDSDVSIANADVAVGDMIEIETDNASTNAVEVEFTILIAIQ